MSIVWWDKEFIEKLSNNPKLVLGQQLMLKSLESQLQDETGFLENGDDLTAVNNLRKQHRDLLCNLGYYFERRSENPADSTKLAVKYYRAALKLYDDPFAQGRIGYFLLRGKGGFRVSDKNKKSGFKFLEISAQQGNKLAIYYLGRCFHDGDGTDQNFDKAEQYYQQALDSKIKNHVEAKLAKLKLDRQAGQAVIETQVNTPAEFKKSKETSMVSSQGSQNSPYNSQMNGSDDPMSASLHTKHAVTIKKLLVQDQTQPEKTITAYIPSNDAPSILKPQIQNGKPIRLPPMDQGKPKKGEETQVPPLEEIQVPSLTA